MKHIYTYCFFYCLVFCIACGGDKTNNSKSEKKASVNSVDIVKAEESQEAKKIVGETKEEQTETQGATPEQLAKAKEIIKAVSEKDIDAVDAKKKYKMFCTSCHGFDGNLMINGSKDLTKSKISLEESVAQVYFGKGTMTPFKGLLKDAEIIAIAKYIEKEIRK